MVTKVHSVFVTRRETLETKQKRLDAKRKHQEERSERRQRFKGYTPSPVLDSALCKRLEGTPVEKLSLEQIRFLKDNFHVGQVEYKGQQLLHFLTPKEREGMKVDILKLVAENTGIEKRTVKTVYEGLREVIKSELKENRKCKLPKLAVINLRFKPARKAGKVPNKFKPGTFFNVKSRKAMNKLKINPLKPLREFSEKLPVVENLKEHKGKGRKVA